MRNEAFLTRKYFRVVVLLGALSATPVATQARADVQIGRTQVQDFNYVLAYSIINETADQLAARLSRMAPGGYNLNVLGPVDKLTYGTQLLWALDPEEMKKLRLLVQHGYNIDQIDGRGTNVLLTEVRRGQFERARTIVQEFGANPRLTEKDGTDIGTATASSIGDEAGQIDAKIAFLNSVQGFLDFETNSFRMLQASLDRPAVLTKLLEMGANPQARGPNGENLLFASLSGDGKISKARSESIRLLFNEPRVGTDMLREKYQGQTLMERIETATHQHQGDVDSATEMGRLREALSARTGNASTELRDLHVDNSRPIQIKK